MYRSVLENKDFIRWSHESLVMLVAHNELGHEETKETDSYGKEVRHCTLYPGLTCREHLDVAVDIDTARADDLVKVPFLELCPNTWLVSPTGDVSQVSEEDQFAAGKIRDQVEALQKKLGAAVPAKRFAALKERAANADLAIDESRYHDALTHLAVLGKALNEPHAALKDFIATRVSSIDTYVTTEFESLRDDKRLPAAEKRAGIEKLLEVLNVEILGARPPCHAAITTWLESK